MKNIWRIYCFPNLSIKFDFSSVPLVTWIFCENKRLMVFQSFHNTPKWKRNLQYFAFCIGLYLCSFQYKSKFSVTNVHGPPNSALTFSTSDSGIKVVKTCTNRPHRKICETCWHGRQINKHRYISLLFMLWYSWNHSLFSRNRTDF